MLSRCMAQLRTQGQPQPASRDRLVCPLQTAYLQEAHICRSKQCKGFRGHQHVPHAGHPRPGGLQSKSSTSALQVARLQEALSEKEQALRHSEQAGNQEQQRLQGQCQQLQEQVRTRAYCCPAVSCCCGVLLWGHCQDLHVQVGQDSGWMLGTCKYVAMVQPGMQRLQGQRQQLQLVGSLSCLLLPACL